MSVIAIFHHLTSHSVVFGLPSIHELTVARVGVIES
jgi:hypothetical protein